MTTKLLHDIAPGDIIRVRFTGATHNVEVVKVNPKTILGRLRSSAEQSGKLIKLPKARIVDKVNKVNKVDEVNKVSNALDDLLASIKKQS